MCVNERVLTAVNVGHQEPHAGHEQDLGLSSDAESGQLGAGSYVKLEDDALLRILIRDPGASNREA